MTLASVISERKRDLRLLAKKLKAVDTQLEKTERKIKSIRSRKIKVPEVKDLDELNGMSSQIDRLLDDYIGAMADLAKAWYNL
jgi:hypothetical protein